MIDISRENIKNLPDELDFGNVQLDGIVNYETINKYKIYNYVFEGMIINAGVEVEHVGQCPPCCPILYGAIEASPPIEDLLLRLLLLLVLVFLLEHPFILYSFWCFL
jgi:hypothetical protein